MNRGDRRALVGSGKFLVLWLALGTTAAACDDNGAPDGPSPSSSASARPGALSPELAARVLARVGDRVITLGEYASTLERMDQFERIRYQTPDRRRQLLDELINLELLAREAERRGLDQRPEAQELERQLLREELLSRVRADLPALDKIPIGDVRKYYETHRADFKDPERRRLSHIVVRQEATAKKVLEKAREASPKKWGELVKAHSLDKPSEEVPLELSGDLGIVTPPSFGENDNENVPEPVRVAAFSIPKLGGVHPELVRAGDRFHVVRLTGKTGARDRTLQEAERTIRVKLLRERIHAAEVNLERDLRKKYPVTIDEKALENVSVPKLGTKK